MAHYSLVQNDPYRGSGMFDPRKQANFEKFICTKVNCQSFQN